MHALKATGMRHCVQQYPHLQLDHQQNEDEKHIQQQFRCLIVGYSDTAAEEILTKLCSASAVEMIQEDMQRDIVRRIRTMVLETTLTNIELMKQKNMNLHTENLEGRIRQRLLNNPLQADWEIGRDITNLWGEDQRFRTMLMHSKLGSSAFKASSEFFIENAEVVFQENYHLTAEDLVQLRLKSSGMAAFTLNAGCEFDISLSYVGDVNGLHRKITHHFDNVDCILYAIDVSRFDGVVTTATSKSYIDACLADWKDLIHREELKHRSLVLVMCNVDQLAHKLRRVPLTELYADYQGRDHSVYEGLQYFESKFRDEARKAQRQLLLLNDNASEQELLDEFLDVCRVISKRKEISHFPW